MEFLRNQLMCEIRSSEGKTGNMPHMTNPWVQGLGFKGKIQTFSSSILSKISQDGVFEKIVDV
jgi:hypothetical protein